MKNWIEASFTLQNNAPEASTEHPLFAIDAMLKAVASAWEGWPENLFFRPVGDIGSSMQRGGVYTVRLILPKCDEPAMGERTLDALEGWLRYTSKSQFSILRRFPSERFTEERALRSLSGFYTAKHLCLMFSTPLFLESLSGRWKGDLEAKKLASLLIGRIEELFGLFEEGERQRLIAPWNRIAVNSFHWDYVSYQHLTKLHKEGRTLSGYLGPVWLSGDIGDILPLLALGTRLNLGKRLHTGQGAFDILPATEWFDRRIDDPRFWMELASRTPHTFYDIAQGGIPEDPTLLRLGLSEMLHADRYGHLSADLAPPLDSTTRKLLESFSSSGERNSATEDVTLSPLRRPFYFTHKNAAIGLSGNEIVGRSNGEIVGRVAIGQVNLIVLFGSGSVTVPLLRECSARKIPVVLCKSSGKFENVIAPNSAAWRNRNDEQLLHWHRLGEEGRTKIAKKIVSAKMANHAAWLNTPDLKKQVALYRIRLEEERDLESIMGLEGHISNLCFREIDFRIIPPFFKSEARIPHEKVDPWNVLMDTASSIVHTRIATLLHGFGLSPYRGFLHQQHDRYATLAADLQELFRARTERFLLGLVNQGIIQERHFNHDGIWHLKGDGWHILLERIERELATQRKGDPDTWIGIMEEQVRRLGLWSSGHSPLFLYCAGQWWQIE